MSQFASMLIGDTDINTHTHTHTHTHTLCDGSSDRSFMLDKLSSTTGVTKSVVRAILSVGMVHIKKNLAANRKE